MVDNEEVQELKIYISQRRERERSKRHVYRPTLKSDILFMNLYARFYIDNIAQSNIVTMKSDINEFKPKI